jgi:hypothetical protein
VAGPGILRPLGSLDEQDGIGIRREDYRNCSPEERRILVLSQAGDGQPFAEASKPASQCEYDP